MVDRPAVMARGLRKRFGKTQALAGVAFDIPAGSIVGLVGPNGSGKTTTIRTCVGRLRPDEGETRVLGVPSAALQGRGAPRIGYMPQQGGLYPELTLRQNMMFYARILRIPRHERLARVDTALDAVQLVERDNDRVATLSGGMRRRASLAAALVHDPEVLFLDEPTVGVDPEVREMMWAGLRREAAEGRTVVISTHYLGEAINCDRVLLMREGKVLAHDAPSQLMRRTHTDDLEAAFLKLIHRGQP